MERQDAVGAYTWASINFAYSNLCVCLGCVSNALVLYIERVWYDNGYSLCFISIGL